MTLKTPLAVIATITVNGLLFACGDATPRTPEVECECQSPDQCTADGTCICPDGAYGERCEESCDCSIGGLCDDGAEGSGSCSDDYVLDMAFERLGDEGLSPVGITVTLTNNGTGVPGADVVVEGTVGTIEPVVDVGDGRYSGTLTPSRTGEHPLTATAKGVSITRVPVVLTGVGAEWGQAVAVPGLVNTGGWEDGATITPDGEYLFIQTSPNYFSGLILMGLPRDRGGCGGQRLEPTRCSHPWLDTLAGPYTAPERPGFFDGRFDGDTMLHNSNLWDVGVDQAPNYAVATMFYGFKRLADGTFGEPFYVAFDDMNDAIINPSGLSFLMNEDGTATTLFTLEDPSDTDMIDVDGDGTDDIEAKFDVFTTEITLGENNSLGSWTVGRPPQRETLNATRLPFGDTGTDGAYGTQNNAHLYPYDGRPITAIFTDDEFDGEDADPNNDDDYHDISVYVLSSGEFPDGTWDKVVLPSPVNDDLEEIQPFFTGDHLYFTRETNIYRSAFSGTDTAAGYGDAGSWSAPVPILEKDTSGQVGTVLALGEPTLAPIDGVETLFFVYAQVRSIDEASGMPDLDLQVGLVPRRE